MNFLKIYRYFTITAALTFLLSACGGGGASSSALVSPVSASLVQSQTGAMPGDSNVVAIYMDAGPVTTNHVINAMFVDIQICAPGSTTQCAVIDHVLVDTGSTGLRLMSSAIPASLVSALPQVPLGSGVAGECLHFVQGFTWGGVRQLDLHWGGSNYTGEVARTLNTQIIADTDTRVVNAPSSCVVSGGGIANAMQTVAQLGAKGIIGIGVFKYDCGTACVSTTGNGYYACASSCISAATPLASQVTHPISLLTTNNNGSTIALPSLSKNYADQVAGLLVLGIGTQTNNALTQFSSVVSALPYSAGYSAGTFTSVFNGHTLGGSYMDSGTSLNYFPAAGTLPYLVCTPASSTSFVYGLLCPTSPVTLTANIFNTANLAGASTSATVYTVNAQTLVNSASSANAFAGLAGNQTATSNMVFGGSFFFGRSIATLIENQSASGMSVTGPAFAYTP